MDTLLKEKITGFYLDVVRYSFNYLFDNEIDDLRIYLDTESEKKIITNIQRHCFRKRVKPKEDDNVVVLTLDNDGLSLSYTKGDYDLTFNQYIDLLYNYADKDDLKVTQFVQKRLFKESLDYGFKRIGLK